MIIKLLENSPFLMVGGLFLLLAKILAAGAEKPGDLRHAKGVVTRIYEKYDTGGYRADVRILAESGKQMTAIITDLSIVRDGEVGDEIDIDYYQAQNGTYYALTEDSRYISGSSPESRIKMSRLIAGFSWVLIALYAGLTLYAFVS